MIDCLWDQKNGRIFKEKIENKSDSKKKCHKCFCLIRSKMVVTEKQVKRQRELHKHHHPPHTAIDAAFLEVVDPITNFFVLNCVRIPTYISYFIFYLQSMSFVDKCFLFFPILLPGPQEKRKKEKPSRHRHTQRINNNKIALHSKHRE